jgi:hypothetical protein
MEVDNEEEHESEDGNDGDGVYSSGGSEFRGLPNDFDMGEPRSSDDDVEAVPTNEVAPAPYSDFDFGIDGPRNSDDDAEAVPTNEVAAAPYSDFDFGIDEPRNSDDDVEPAPNDGVEPSPNNNFDGDDSDPNEPSAVDLSHSAELAAARLGKRRMQPADSFPVPVQAEGETPARREGSIKPWRAYYPASRSSSVASSSTQLIPGPPPTSKQPLSHAVVSRNPETPANVASQLLGRRLASTVEQPSQGVIHNPAPSTSKGPSLAGAS